MKSPRSVVVLLDTAVVAAIGVTVLVVAARSLPPQDLTVFSLMILVVTSAVAFQRTALLAPALATQRSDGPGVVPLKWGLMAGPPIAIVGTAIMASVPIEPDERLPVLFCCFIATFSWLVVDVIRRNLLTRSMWKPLILLDGSFAVSVLGLSLFAILFGDGLLSLAVAFATGSGLTLLLLPIARRNVSAHRYFTLKGTWRLGSWAALDSLMSISANFIPLIATTALIDVQLAGEYRVLQSAAGPLNIIATALITSTGLQAWHFTTAESVRRLKRTALRQSFSLALLALVYLALAALAVTWLAGLESSTILRVTIVVGIAGVLSAFSVPLQAAALSLGQQRFGAFTRILVVAVAVLVSVPEVARFLPWQDPIAATSIVAAILSLVGWSLALFLRKPFSQASLDGE